MEQRPVFRHEEKYLISSSDRVLLISRLSAILKRDSNSNDDGTYRIRSVYFDDLFNSAFYDSLDGISRKQKYRIRMYDNDPKSIFIEKKIKSDNGGLKLREKLTEDEVKNIFSGHYDFLLQKNSSVCCDFYSALKNGLRPVTVIDYRRTAFFSSPGNIRITIDDDIRSCQFSNSFFNNLPSGVTLTENGTCVLEVKYDAFLPDHIKKLIGVRNLFRSGFSKYTKSRKII